MPFITIKDKEFLIDDSDTDEKLIIEAFAKLNKFDDGAISCGLNSGPDFGYFGLAERFWDASLCIYFAGVTNCFMGSGIGYSETWLFNARHAVELFIKGFLVVSTVWFKELQDDPFASGEKVSLTKLNKQHNLYEIYQKYKTNIETVIQSWNTSNILGAPNINDVLLQLDTEAMLKELDETDSNGFRFRYPSLTQDGVHYLQEMDWKRDPAKLFPKTGLPREAGYFFEHIKVINSLHQIVKEMKEIRDGFDGFFDYHQELRYEHLTLSKYFYEFDNEI